MFNQCLWIILLLLADGKNNCGCCHSNRGCCHNPFGPFSGRPSNASERENCKENNSPFAASGRSCCEKPKSDCGCSQDFNTGRSDCGCPQNFAADRSDCGCSCDYYTSQGQYVSRNDCGCR